jgi:hypothetical protein
VEKPVDDHLEKVRAWLELNVHVPPKPKKVTLSEITFDWNSGRGSFVLNLDEHPVKDLFRIYVEMNGQMAFTPPLHISPLGAPASYAAIKLDESTEQAIKKALSRVFPKFLAYGRHKGRDAYIDALTPLGDRVVNDEEFVEKKSLLKAGASVDEAV